MAGVAKLLQEKFLTVYYGGHDAHDNIKVSLL